MKTVLIVDDNPEMRAYLATLIRSWGFAVREAPSADVAMGVIATGDCPDIIVCDLMMPGMDGLELLAAVREREHRADCRILFVMLTGYPSVQTGVRAIDEGADEYLVKPIVPDQLLTVLQRAEPASP